MIEVKKLTKSYGDRLAIDHLSFSIPKGKIVGFLGPNGAGKTTTMKIITGFMAPSSGEVRVGGFDVFEDPLAVKAKIGYLPETPPLYTEMKVLDYLKFAAGLRKVASDKIQENVDRALAKTNLTDVKNRRIQNLSKGYKQRVGIAQALVSNPEVLILDEPTVGLDPKQVQEIRSLIQSLKGQHTVILSTHILPEVQATCDEVIIINEGKIVAKDSIQSLMNNFVGDCHIQLQVLRSDTGVVEQLKNNPHVKNISAEGNHISLTLPNNEQFIAEVAEVVVKSKSGLVSLTRESNNLEQIFIKLTEKSSSGNSL